MPQQTPKNNLASGLHFSRVYVIDVDSYLMLFKHQHKVDDHRFVCEHCLDMARTLTLQLCDLIKRYYQKVAVIFSGCAGFHVHISARYD